MIANPLGKSRGPRATLHNIECVVAPQFVVQVFSFGSYPAASLYRDSRGRADPVN